MRRLRSQNTRKSVNAAKKPPLSRLFSVEALTWKRRTGSCIRARTGRRCRRATRRQCGASRCPATARPSTTTSTRDAKGDLESARQPVSGGCRSRIETPRPGPAASHVRSRTGTSTVLPCAWGSLLETAREPALADNRTASCPLHADGLTRVGDPASRGPVRYIAPHTKEKPPHQQGFSGAKRARTTDLMGAIHGRINVCLPASAAGTRGVGETVAGVHVIELGVTRWPSSSATLASHASSFYRSPASTGSRAPETPDERSEARKRAARATSSSVTSLPRAVPAAACRRASSACSPPSASRRARRPRKASVATGPGLRR